MYLLLVGNLFTLTVFSDFGKGEENADCQRNFLPQLQNSHKSL